MIVHFQIPERIAGFAAEAGQPGDTVQVLCSEGLTSLDGSHLTWRLEELHRTLFGRVPGLPEPSQIDNLLVVIRHDLKATAYVNELRPRLLVKTGRSITAGQHIYVDDVLEISKLELGVPVPEDCAFVLVRSFGWRKSVLYDFCPLGEPHAVRGYDLSKRLAEQAFQLLKGKFEDKQPISQERPNLQRMKAGLDRLVTLLKEQHTEEATYQELLESEKWYLSGHYKDIRRHPQLDDTSIPDFVAQRNHDDFLDVIEMKQPFAQCFKKDHSFNSVFNDAWNQLEQYLSFTRRNRDYLRNEKDLRFENPRGILIAGHDLSDRELRLIRDKETMNPTITVLTYNQLVALAQAMYDLAKAAQGQ